MGEYSSSNSSSGLQDESGLGSNCSDEETENSVGTKLVALQLKPSNKTGKAELNVGSIIRMAGAATKDCDTVGILATGRGEVDITAGGGISYNVGNGGIEGDENCPFLDGEKITALRVTNKSVVKLNTPNVDGNVNPGPGECVAVFEANTDGTLSIDSTQLHRMGRGQMSRKDTASRYEEGMPVPSQKVQFMSARGQMQASQSGPRGTGTVNNAESGGVIIHKGYSVEFINPSPNQDLEVNKARLDGKVVYEKTSQHLSYMGHQPTFQQPTNFIPKDFRPYQPPTGALNPTVPSEGTIQVPAEEDHQRENVSTTLQTARVEDPSIGTPILSPGNRDNETARIVYLFLSRILNQYLWTAIQSVFTGIGSWFSRR